MPLSGEPTLVVFPILNIQIGFANRRIQGQKGTKRLVLLVSIIHGRGLYIIHRCEDFSGIKTTEQGWWCLILKIFVLEGNSTITQLLNHQRQDMGKTANGKVLHRVGGRLGKLQGLLFRRGPSGGHQHQSSTELITLIRS